MASQIRKIQSYVQASKKKELPEKRITISPSDAQLILEKYNHGNRHKKDRMIRSFAEDMKHGRWLDGTGNNIKFSKEGVLIDGQNRLSSVVVAGVPQTFAFRFGLDPEVQKVIDIGSPRRLADTIMMHGYRYSNLISSVTTMLRSFMANPYKPYSNNNNNRASKYELDGIALENADEFLSIYKKLTEYEIKNVVVESVAVFAYYVLSRTKHKARIDEFFEKLGIGANMKTDDPVFIVHKRLMIDKRMLREQKNKDAALGLIFKAWNLFVANQTTTNKMHTPLAIPPIAGLTKINGQTVYDHAPSEDEQSEPAEEEVAA